MITSSMNSTTTPRPTTNMSDQQSQTECAICMNPITSDTGQTVLSCKHVFHLRCVTRWFQSDEGNGRCPTCRSDPSEMEQLIPRPQHDTYSDSSETADGDESSEGDHEGTPPLVLALERHKNDEARELLAAIPSGDERIDAKDTEGFTALAQAVYEYHEIYNDTLDIIKELLEKGADLRNVAVYTMLPESGEIVEDEDNEDFNNSALPFIPLTHPDRMNAVLVAGLMSSCYEIVEIALVKGANINYRNPRSGETPLLFAMRSHLCCRHVQNLIEKGANIYAVDYSNTTIWEYCDMETLRGNELFEMLLGQTNPFWKLVFNKDYRGSIVRFQALWRGHRIRKQRHTNTTNTTNTHTVLLPVLCDASHCDKVGTFMCGNCKDTYYCSQACQKSQYKQHKSVCLSVSHSPALAIGSP